MYFILDVVKKKNLSNILNIDILNLFFILMKLSFFVFCLVFLLLFVDDLNNFCINLFLDLYIKDLRDICKVLLFFFINWVWKIK